MKRIVCTCSILFVFFGIGSFEIHASRISQTPDLGAEREVYEIYNDRYSTAYECSAELDAMRVHDMDLFDLSADNYV